MGNGGLKSFLKNLLHPVPARIVSASALDADRGCREAPRDLSTDYLRKAVDRKAIQGSLRML
jgi:hypothetical protein